MKRILLIPIFMFIVSFGSNASALAQSDYTRTWLICGPFENSDLETECFANEAQIMPKESEISGGKEWKKYTSFEDKINFEEAFGSYNNCVGYAYVEVKSPQRKEVMLFLGSDDGVKVWLNGRNILTNDTPRALTFDEDKLNVVLEAGWNRLLLKVNNLGGGWGFSARFSDYQNLALNDLEYRPKALKPLSVKEVTASSVEANKANLSAANVIDGDFSTRWSSVNNDPQWICLDLGEPTEISRVLLAWEAAYAQNYKIELSDDKENWTEVYSIDSGRGGRNLIFLKEPHTARYVRLYCVKRANENWGYSLWEFQVFGPKDSSPY